MPSPNPTAAAPIVDLELVAQRISKLAEIATLEHLEMLLNSQADGLLALSCDVNTSLQFWAEPKG